jgi:hypothetical protein
MLRNYFIDITNPFRLLFILAYLLPRAFSITVYGETEEEKITTVILEQDRLFWKAYNNCDTESFRRFFTDDVEFYHDRGGVTLGLDALTDSVKTNLCGNNSRRVRREAVPETVRVFLLHNGKEIYGAIISGEHLFFVKESGKSEYLDSRANFTHLWLIKNGVPKMTRVLSFNHHSVPQLTERHETEPK